MNAAQYERLTARLRARPGLCKALVVADRVLELAFYPAYVLLIAYLLFLGSPVQDSSPLNPLLLPCVLIPVSGLLVTSLLRKGLNRPRPYEALEIDPLIKKDTKGQSFPSKHAYSSVVIALCWWQANAVMGAVLLTAALAICLLRVVGGVHFPRDVFAGALIAFACASLFMVW